MTDQICYDLKVSEPLSDDLPTAIRQAVDDMLACAAHPAYAVHMMTYHSPLYNPDNKCEVCLGGAVLARRDPELPPTHTDTSQWPDYRRIEALSNVALGALEKAAQYWDHNLKEKPPVELECNLRNGVSTQARLDTPEKLAAAAALFRRRADWLEKNLV
jgi:hypothetical protein